MKITNRFLNLREPVARRLQQAGIETIEQLAEWSFGDWMQFAEHPGIGKRTIIEICCCVIDLARGEALKRAREFDRKCPLADEDLTHVRYRARVYEKIANIVLARERFWSDGKLHGLPAENPHEHRPEQL